MPLPEHGYKIKHMECSPNESRTQWLAGEDEVTFRFVPDVNTFYEKLENLVFGLNATLNVTHSKCC